MSPFISQENNCPSSSSFSFPFCRMDSSPGVFQSGVCPTDTLIALHNSCSFTSQELPGDCKCPEGRDSSYSHWQDGSKLDARLRMIELNCKNVAKIIVAPADGSWSHPSCPPLPYPEPWGSPSFPNCPGPPSLLTPEGLCYCGSSDLQLHLAESNQKCEYSPSIWHTSSEL